MFRQSVLLSILFPGLGQLVQGKKPAGFALMSATAGVFLLVFYDPSVLTTLFGGIAYISLIWHSAKDALHQTRNTESVEYILSLACVIGPFCLPLLWQNEQLKTRGKTILTIIILIITGLLIASMAYLDPMINQMLDSYKTILPPGFLSAM